MDSKLKQEISKIYNGICPESVGGEQVSCLSTAPDAQPLYVVTGASFTPYDRARFTHEATHAIFKNAQGVEFLMNTGAATAMKLIEHGHRVIVHGASAESMAAAMGPVAQMPGVTLLGGDMADPSTATALIALIQRTGAAHAISDVRLMAYQSFAQNSGMPFKPMHEEKISEVERAATRRIRFVFNMAAVGYWLLQEQGQKDLRVVVMSALAANRPSYGLVADTADKFMNESCWRTFHLESNYLTQKPVNVVQVCPGITTSCGVYQGPHMHDFILNEAIADGHPMDASAPLPQISAHDVAEVVTRMLVAAPGDDPNEGLPASVQKTLYGGYSEEHLKDIFNRAVDTTRQGVSFGLDRPGPEHLYAPYTQYGRLPVLKAGSYQRVSMTPPGQTF